MTIAHVTQMHLPGGVELVGDRVGVPLPALTAAHAVSQLVHRVVGPGGWDLVPVLEWARGGDQGVITARYELPSAALERRLRIMKAEGARTPLRQAVVDELSAPGAHSYSTFSLRRLSSTATRSGNGPTPASRPPAPGGHTVAAPRS